MRYSLSFITDLIFTAFISFILLFVILSYSLSRGYAILYSALFALLITLITFKLRGEKARRKKLKKQEEELTDGVIDALNFMPKNSIVELFQKALSAKGADSEIRRGGLLDKANGNLMIFKFGFTPVNKADVVKAFNARIDKGKATIYSETFSDDVKEFTARFDGAVVLCDKRAVFSFLKDGDALPEIQPKAKKRQNFNTKLKGFFAVKKAKKYLAFGILFMLFSFVTIFKLYYVVFGSVMLIFALLCRLYGKRDESDNQ